MLNENEKKTLKYFGPLFLVACGTSIFIRVFGIKVISRKIVLPHYLDILFLILMLICSFYVISFLVLAYKSADILKKYGKTKMLPIFWLLLLFVPFGNLIAPVILWRKSNQLLKEDAGKPTGKPIEKKNLILIICSILLILFFGFYFSNKKYLNTLFYSLRGLRYLTQHKDGQAMLDLNKVLELRPNDARGYNVRGLFYAYKGNYDQAISDLNRAIEIDPNFSKAYLNRGLAYLQKGNYDQAVFDYTKGIELNSPNNSDAYINRGLAYDKKGNYDQAIADYTKALELSPNDARIYNNRGWVYAEKGDVDKALSDCNKAIEINPKDAAFYDSRAFTYYKKQEYDKAWDDVYKAKMLGFKADPKFLEELRKSSGREK